MAKLSLIVDSVQAEQALQNFARTTDAVTVATGRVGSGLATLTRQLTTLAVVYKALDFARESVRAADAMERQERIFRAAFGGMSRDAATWARTMSDAMGVSRERIMEAGSGFKILLDNMGLAGERSTDLAMRLTEVGSKLDQVYGLPAGEAARAIEGGLAGMGQQLRQLGIIVDDVAVRDYALRQGWITDIEKLSRLGETQARVNLIMEQASRITRDALPGTRNYTEAVERYNKAFSDLKVTIGTDLLPVAIDFMRGLETIIKGIERGVSAAERAVKDTTKAVGDAVKAGGAPPLGMMGSLRTGGLGINWGQPERSLLGEGYATEDELRRWGAMWQDASRMNAQLRAQAKAMAAPTPEGIVDTTAAKHVLEQLKLEQSLLRMTNVERETTLKLQDAAITKSHEMAAAIEHEVAALERVREWRQMANEIGDSFGQALESIAMGALHADQMMRMLAMDIGRAVLRQTVIRPITEAISSGIMGLMRPSYLDFTGYAHGGGLIGYDPLPQRAVDPLLFLGAPRLHGGLFPGEYPAVLQHGETVLPAGTRPNVTVNITNNSPMPVTASMQDIQVDLRRMVLNVVLEDQQTNGPLTRGFRR